MHEFKIFNCMYLKLKATLHSIIKWYTIRYMNVFMHIVLYNSVIVIDMSLMSFSQNN